MKRDFNAIAGKIYDVIVIGGGIVGAGVARDTVLRGLDTLLVEKEDFGFGTTSRSTRLIHGGLRYLRQLEFGLVRQDLSEREVLLRIAPHLVTPLPFLIPIHNIFLNIAMFFGTILYDVISFDKTLPNHRFYSRKKTEELEPGLRVQNLQGSYLYYDCKIPNTERLNFETALSAYEAGATVVNHARVIGLAREGDRISGVEVKDEISGQTSTAKGRLIVNAAGHWVDTIHNMLFPGQPDYLRRTKGVHLVIPKVSEHALVLFSPLDGRLFFVIPWEGYSLVGTTDTDYRDNLDAVGSTREDADYLLKGLHLAYPDVKFSDIHYAYAGLRSLALKRGRSASDTSRSHELIDHAHRDGLEGLVTILGGKITAYRAVARDAADLVCRKLKKRARCITDERPLPGAPAVKQAEIIQVSSKSGLSIQTVQHLATHYGSRYSEVLEVASRDSNLKLPLCSRHPDIAAQVWHAVERESALTLNDFMLRRSLIGLQSDLGLDAVNQAAAAMGKALVWSRDEEQRQIQAFQDHVELARSYLK